MQKRDYTKENSDIQARFFPQAPINRDDYRRCNYPGCNRMLPWATCRTMPIKGGLGACCPEHFEKLCKARNVIPWNVNSRIDDHLNG